MQWFDDYGFLDDDETRSTFDEYSPTVYDLLYWKDTYEYINNLPED